MPKISRVKLHKQIIIDDTRWLAAVLHESKGRSRDHVRVGIRLITSQFSVR